MQLGQGHKTGLLLNQWFASRGQVSGIIVYIKIKWLLVAVFTVVASMSSHLAIYKAEK